MADAAAGRRTPEPDPNESALTALMVRYQCGDRAAAESLIREVSPMLYRFLSWPAGRMEGEDLLQECWLRVHKARHTYRPPAPVLPWLFAIARHAKIDSYRRYLRVQAREVPVESAPEPVAKPPLPRDDDMVSLLAQLPDSQREVLIMMKVSGMSLTEVARATSSTVGAVKQKAHRGYTRLRQLLTEAAGKKR